VEEHRDWLMERWAEKAVASLKKHDFDAVFVQTAAEARELILAMVEPYDSFGFGGSDTVRALGLVEALREKGKAVYDHWQAGLSKEADLEIRLQQGRSDCFLCSANAVSLTGEVVNVDGIGNRTAAMSFGPRKVIVAAGVNKLTPDLPSALRRVKEVAAPMRARSLGMKTPCAETGICSDCSAPQRICRITTILERRPLLTDMTIILIGRSMGF